MRRSRQGGQAIVEFGFIAILFTLLMFAIVDFGLLLTTWLAVSSGSRDIARNASVGKPWAVLAYEATKLSVPAVDRNYAGGPCCTSTSALSLTVDYFDHCIPGPGCTTPIPLSSLLPAYGGSPGGCCHPVSDDSVRVTLVANGAQVITPLVRPFFGCTNAAIPTCYVPLTTTVIMRFEGQEF